MKTFVVRPGLLSTSTRTSCAAKRPLGSRKYPRRATDCWLRRLAAAQAYRRVRRPRPIPRTHSADARRTTRRTSPPGRVDVQVPRLTRATADLGHCCSKLRRVDALPLALARARLRLPLKCWDARAAVSLIPSRGYGGIAQPSHPVVRSQRERSAPTSSRSRSGWQCDRVPLQNDLEVKEIVIFGPESSAVVKSMLGKVLE